MPVPAVPAVPPDGAVVDGAVDGVVVVLDVAVAGVVVVGPEADVLGVVAGAVCVSDAVRLEAAGGTDGTVGGPVREAASEGSTARYRRYSTSPAGG